MIPELAFEEQKTRKLLLSYLEQIPLLKIHRFRKSTGILVEYSQGEGEYILFRADMDALPISEQTGCAFSSRHPGKMHACGHDLHMTILLGLIERTVREKSKRNLLFLFQPAEEGKGGAEAILWENLLDDYQIKAAIALHVNGKLPLGTVSAKAGVFFANTQEFDVEFTGKSAHAAFPEQGKNAMLAALDFIRAMNESVTSLQKYEKVIINIGTMQAGSVRNVVPDKCLLEGTHRTLSQMTREILNREMISVSQQAAAKYEVIPEVRLLCAYDCVENDTALYEILRESATELKLQFIESDVYMTGEDFGAFCARYHGLLFWLGASSPENDLHTPGFLPDEKCIFQGIDIFAKLLEHI